METKADVIDFAKHKEKKDEKLRLKKRRDSINSLIKRSTEKADDPK